MQAMTSNIRLPDELGQDIQARRRALKLSKVELAKRAGKRAVLASLMDEYARLKARHVAGLMSERLQKTRVVAVERWQAGRGQGDGSTPHMER